MNISAQMRVVVFFLVTGVVSGAAMEHPPGTVIPIAPVLSALLASDVPLQKARVSFLTAVRWKNPTALEMAEIQGRDHTSVIARVRCRDHRSCLPFYVLVSWQSAEAKNAAVANFFPEPLKPKAREAKDIVVRAGEQATLIMEDKAVRVSTRIVCMQSGGRGEKIRVQSPDHKRIAVAEVVEPGLLKGSL